eukprot:CAMPEP_0181209886 /NCGR_PEP_ID=MMETSP1096-20121128/22927_1 /TAXON_ID=156174 ORGANISM="Chrysochromulina ericina, Strain CCMP281" /NCGR_SAMPLE_ID=MMETSP1096 /ASSEMBLY_ACC=CAM_ASM_000453 /LENGTH=96 /DNA_ID=CAMNT_0023301121 /DNA_START=370 /DNA_END=660 /DNA_ORIENTATION=-
MNASLLLHDAEVGDDRTDDKEKEEEAEEAANGDEGCAVISNQCHRHVERRDQGRVRCYQCLWCCGARRRLKPWFDTRQHERVDGDGAEGEEHGAHR